MTTETSNKAEENKSLTDKETLLTWAIQMCNIAYGLVNFVNNAEHYNNAKKKYSIFFLNNALHRMDSCIVLLKHGSMLLKGKTKNLT